MDNKMGVIRFTNEDYAKVDLRNEEIKLTVEHDGVVDEYDVTGGSGASGSFTLDQRTFPNTLSADSTYQIVYTVSNGATVEFASNAANTKIKVDETGLLTCIGETLGVCKITMTFKNSNGDVIGVVTDGIEVI